MNSKLQLLQMVVFCIIGLSNFKLSGPYLYYKNGQIPRCLNCMDSTLTQGQQSYQLIPLLSMANYFGFIYFLIIFSLCYEVNFSHYRIMKRFTCYKSTCFSTSVYHLPIFILDNRYQCIIQIQDLNTHITPLYGHVIIIHTFEIK